MKCQVMSRRLNKTKLSLVCSKTVCLLDDAHRLGSRSFQTQGSETAKLGSPKAIVLVLHLYC